MKQLDVLRSLKTRVHTASIFGVLVLSVMAGGSASAQTPTDGVDLTPDAVLSYLAAHRDDAALVTYTVRDDGGIDRTDGVLSHNADMRMPLGSIIKIVTLATYAREVVAGRLNPEEPITIADWERFYLPLRDGTAHQTALEVLGLAHDDLGFALDRQTAIPLGVLMRVMIQFSDNAAPDWLLDRLGPEPFRATIRAARLKGQDEPLPILGLFLSWRNHTVPAISWREIRRLGTLEPVEYRTYVSSLVSAYQDPQWRAQELAFLRTASPTVYEREAVLADALYPHGTARDYARIMAGVAAGTFISPAVSELMSAHLQWLMQIPVVAERFFAWGQKGGSLAGVVTDTNFFVARDGDFAGKRRVAILFLRHLPEWALSALLTTGGQTLFDAALAHDRSFFDRVANTLAESDDSQER